MATILPAAHGSVAASGMEGDPIQGGKALRSSIGLAGAPVPVEFDHLLRGDGNASVTAIGRKPPGGPMHAESREPETQDLDRRTASHLRIIPPTVHGAISLQRRTIVGTATEVRSHPASIPRPATRRRAVGEPRRRDRTQLQAGVIQLRSRIQASAVSGVAELRRRDRTQLQAGVIQLRDLLPVRVYLAEVRATPADARAETRDLREAGRAGAEDTAGSRAGDQAAPLQGWELRCRVLGTAAADGSAAGETREAIRQAQLLWPARGVLMRPCRGECTQGMRLLGSRLSCRVEQCQPSNSVIRKYSLPLP